MALSEDLVERLDKTCTCYRTCYRMDTSAEKNEQVTNSGNSLHMEITVKGQVTVLSFMYLRANASNDGSNLEDSQGLNKP